jgi:hypothetical protein
VKNASAATWAILATGSYLLYHLFDVVLTNGQTYHFTDGDVPLQNVTVYVPGGTIGPFNYQTGMTIVRDKLTQKQGTESGQLKCSFIPQGDSPYAPILIAGYPLMEAARYGFLQGATVRMSKLFLIPPAYTGGQLDLSPGAMGYFLGTIQALEADRFFVDLTIEDGLSLLGTQQMPQNLYAVGCFHQVYDPGCGLLAATFTVNGTVETAGDGAHLTTNLTSQANGYFNLGSLTMTSGAAAGQSANVQNFINSSGAFVLLNPFSEVPSPGDTFNVYPGCDRQQATCINIFNNKARFAGVPYMPVPETIVDGGTDNPPVQTQGSQAGQIIGSQPAGQFVYGNYRT